MDRLVHHLHAAEMMIGIFASEFVMVAGNEDHLCSLPRLAQDLLDNVIVRLRPIPGSLEAPPIDNVANQIEVFAFRLFQEIQKLFCLAAFRA